MAANNITQTRGTDNTHSTSHDYDSDGAKLPAGALLVGSVPLASNEEVFRTLSTTLPGRLHSIPDGETGERHYFVRWQMTAFADHPELTRLNNDAPMLSQTALDEAVASIQANGGIQTGYDRHALASYSAFADLRRKRLIPNSVKFQVCLPTPFNALMIIRGPYRTSLEALYTKSLLHALDRIQSQIPQDDLVIQWDCAREFAILSDPNMPFYGEGFDYPASEHFRAITSRMTSLINAVDPKVELGMHCCYGDNDHKHFIEPKDLRLAVDVLNTVAQASSRRINYVHMPVPKDRYDEEYLKPLQHLSLLQNQPNPTKLYLGLVHHDDLEGTKRRIATAGKVLDSVLKSSSFGIATECGMGRTPVEQIPGLLELMAQVSDPV